MTKLHCPQCADSWAGEYDTNHRCLECHAVLMAESHGHLIDELEAEIHDLRTHIKAARDYAGERCAAQEGLVVVHMLEKALGGGK